MVSDGMKVVTIILQFRWPQWQIKWLKVGKERNRQPDLAIWLSSTGAGAAGSFIDGSDQTRRL
jgi:hypothetical protein